MNPTRSPDNSPANHKPPRGWWAKFADAFRGLRCGIQGQSSFAVHFFFAVLVLLLATLLNCDHIDWCLLLGCIGFVITAEMFNTAIETLFRGLDPSARSQVYPCLDIAAGAVFLASLTAASVGSIIFGRKLWFLFDLTAKWHI